MVQETFAKFGEQRLVFIAKRMYTLVIFRTCNMQITTWMCCILNWANNITTKVDDKTNVLNETMRQYKNHDTLPSPTVRTAFDQIHEKLGSNF